MRFVGWLSVPASFVGSSDNVAVTVPEPSAVLIAVPSVCDRAVTGIVTVGEAPRSGGSGPATLLIRITPMAPFACAFAAWFGAAHVALRSMSAILPDTAAAFTNG